MKKSCFLAILSCLTWLLCSTDALAAANYRCNFYPYTQFQAMNACTTGASSTGCTYIDATTPCGTNFKNAVRGKAGSVDWYEYYSFTSSTICSLPWGGSVANGGTVTAYANAAEPAGGSCKSQTRTCSSGTLSGSYTNASCTVATPANCTAPDGTTINHGSSRTFYSAATVPFGSSCSGETRTCSNGVLSGSKTIASCSVTPAASCTLPGGGTLAHGASADYFQTATVPYGTSCSTVKQSRTCNNGDLSGSYTIASCSTEAPVNCTAPDGTTINNGMSATFYTASTVPYGSSCSGELRTCSNGVLSGSNTKASCSVTPAANCAAPGGGTINHGSSGTFYAASSVPFGSSCSSEVRSCSNGALSGSNTATSCSVTPAASCTLPDGGTLAHGGAATFYQDASVPFGSSCASQSRSCNDGTLTGSYTQAACSVTPAASCTGPDGATIAHNGSATYFVSSSVPYGSTCSSESRACFNGTLSGANTHPACSVVEGAQCNLPGGGKLASGQAKDFYKTATVGKGASCDAVKESRVCENGALSGFALFPTCTDADRAGAVESSACANIGAVVRKECDTEITGKKSAVLKTQDVKNHFVRIIKE